MGEDTLLIIASSEANADLYYATHFLAPDPFVFIQDRGETLLLMSDLEVDRAKAQASVDTVLSLSAYMDRARQQGLSSPTTLDAVEVLLRERGITQLRVPSDCPVAYADRLRERGLVVTWTQEQVYGERGVKTEKEVAAIAATQRATEDALEVALEALRASEVRDGQLILDGEVLTAERLRRIIHRRLLEQDCLGQHTIVACGDQACDPHEEGSGPLRPHAAIVLDIFPRSMTTRYYADLSRTVVKGKASDALRRLYDAVRQAQEEAIGMIQEGVSGGEIHERVCRVFETAGYHTGVVDGRRQGFFHGTGHGVGLEIHEPPRIGRTAERLVAGHVVTVEPGLYYPGLGAVRLEDLLVVTKDGARNLTRAPKTLEV